MFFGFSPSTPNDSACGSGDGGAGHCPGRAAARSMRLNVRMCWFTRACFSWGERVDGGTGIGGGSRVMDCLGDFDIGWGGEGVRRAVDTGLTSSKSRAFFFCGVASSDWSDWEALLNPDMRL